MEKKVVICAGVRTPIGQIAKSLSAILPEELLEFALKQLISRAKINPEWVDGFIVGWVGQGCHAPNIARVVGVKAGLPEKIQATTVQVNCVSSLEAVASASRSILVGEGEFYIAGGTESMSTIPFTIQGPRSLKELRSKENLKNHWSTLLENTQVLIADAIEQGLEDPVRRVNMAGTAEICAQVFGISREEQDKYAHETLRRCLEGEKDGFYNTHVVPFQKNGSVLLEKDEYPFLREDLVSKPQMFSKAPLLFDNSFISMEKFYELYSKYMNGQRFESGKTKGTVTLFNSCSRSDGAALLVVTTEEKARQLGLPILARVVSWAFYGLDPVYMGIAPAYASDVALKKANLSFSHLDNIEVHEAFAATTLSIFKVGKDKFGHDWQTKWNEGRMNPHGGSIPLGHPLGATGARLLLNLIYALHQSKGRYGLVTACAEGGTGGAVILERS